MKHETSKRRCEMSELADEINERLIGEYISKVECCDECFASVYCTVNGLRESRVPQKYCVKNIKKYFGDRVKPVDERLQGDLISRSALKEDFKSRLALCNEWIEKAKDKETKIRASAVKAFIGEVIITIDNAPTVPDFKELP